MSIDCMSTHDVMTDDVEAATRMRTTLAAFVVGALCRGLCDADECDRFFRILSVRLIVLLWDSDFCSSSYIVRSLWLQIQAHKS